MTRKTKRAPVAPDLTPYLGLLALLDGLAALPVEPCPACDHVEMHYRCKHCNVCHEAFGDGGCPACKAKPNPYRSVLRQWLPRRPYAAVTGADMAAKIRQGVVPTARAVAFAERLAAEAGRKPTTAERDAIAFLSPRSPAWAPVVVLVARGRLGADGEPWAPSLYTREGWEEVRTLIRQVLEVRTGWDRFLTVEIYADALKAVGVIVGPRGKVSSGDQELENALMAMLELHGWLIREKRVIEAREVVEDRSVA